MTDYGCVRSHVRGEDKAGTKEYSIFSTLRFPYIFPLICGNFSTNILQPVAGVKLKGKSGPTTPQKSPKSIISILLSRKN